MPRAEHIPGPEHRRGQATPANQLLPFPAHCYISLHHRRGLGHAQIHEVRDPRFHGRRHRGLDRHEVDSPELRGFGRSRARRAHEVHECIGRADSLAITLRAQRIAGDSLRSRGQLGARGGTDQGPNRMSSREQTSDEGDAEIPGPASDENRVRALGGGWAQGDVPAVRGSRRSSMSSRTPNP
jgi:hypothetical protein